MQFFLHTCKFFTTFATANQKFADISLKAFALFEDSFKLGHFEITLLRIMRNAHVYTWAFLHILECYGSPSPKEPIAVGSRFCIYMSSKNKMNINFLN